MNHHQTAKLSLATLAALAAAVVLGAILCFAQTPPAAPAPTSQPTAAANVAAAMDAAKSTALAALAALQQQTAIAHGQAAELQQQLASLAAIDNELPPGSDIGPALAAAKDHATIYLHRRASYVCNGTPTIQAVDVHVIGYQSQVLITPAKGASSGIILAGDAIELAGLNIFGPPGQPYTVALRLYGTDPAKRKSGQAGDYIHDCKFDGASIDTAILLDAWADKAQVIHCDFGKCGAESIYCTADDVTVEGCTFAGSIGEHDVRADANASTGHRPERLTVLRCSLTNHNDVKKEALTLRELHGAFLLFNLIDGYCSAGQSGPAGTQHAWDIVAIGNQWQTLRPGGALFQLDHDATALFWENVVPASQTDAAITLDSAGSLWTYNNTEIAPATAAALSSKPFAAFFGGTVTQLDAPGVTK